MNIDTPFPTPAGNEFVQVADTSLDFREVALHTSSPTGEVIAAAAGISPQPGLTVLSLLANGELEDLRWTEQINLASTRRQFVIALADRVYKFDLQGVEYEWPARLISGGQVRKIRAIPEALELFQKLPDGVDRIVGPNDLVDLEVPGVEQLFTRARVWKLNVQGVHLEVPTPTITVRQALIDAGFDVTKAWLIVLRRKGQENQPLDVADTIDLRAPGVEKIRLTPREVVNGDGTDLTRSFALLADDVSYLNSLGCPWETVTEAVPNGDRRWLLIHDYPVPEGFTASKTLLALEIPPTYPQAQIDMFYTYPPLGLPSGHPIPSTQISVQVRGLTLNGWSRHRGPGSPWDPSTDNVVSHLALVESAMAKEA